MNLPIGFSATIGGYFGGYYEVRWNGAALRYRATERNDCVCEETVKPPPEDWRDFFPTLDAVDVWSWSRDYSTPGILDGTSWSLCIAYGEKRVESRGSNGYPKDFRQFLEAVSKLIGGRTFA